MVFDLQEKVTTGILRGHQELTALRVAPQAIDPLQQTVATLIQNQFNHAHVDRRRGIAAIEFLATPMLPVQLKTLYNCTKTCSRMATSAT